MAWLNVEMLPAPGRQFESVVMSRSEARTSRGRPSSRQKQEQPRQRSQLLDRLMPRHAAFIVGLVLGVVTFAIAFFLSPQNSVSLGANGLFIGFLFVTFLKMPHLTADYLRKHAREEDTPVLGIFLIVLLVLVASLVSLFLALSNGQTPDPLEVAISVTSVILGWFTVQAMGALHYAYEYYQVEDAAEGADFEGGLDFQGDDDPDGFDFVYFSYTVGTSVATSDTKIESHKMRRMVTVHLIFSHLFNTIVLAAAVNVLISLGGGGGGG
ncbi:DUF1345 domain-containing protein [Devosia rhizoryzae]|uniref:DUF1345 domain-containing protein n=1 Tax=Devosia rhizoryzae TaxID=2774137 RepID=A0ABX7C8G8_9HYPH|nr:DUF1345 domain-containing protein [Devosia rhizoryzae]QQR40416.1 DUF1345 domain-containing protein [Devosia rhizoryzae]